MTPEKERRLDTKTQTAVAELEGMISQVYPTATFRVRRGIDDPESIHLVTTVDVEDTDAVLDAVVDRVMELQIDEGLPIHVIPVRPLARVLAMRQARTQAPERTRRGSAPLHP